MESINTTKELLNNYFVFRAADEMYAVAMKSVLGLLSERPVRVLPYAPGYVHGVLNLFDESIMIINFNTLVDSQNFGTDRCFLLVEDTENMASLRLGLLIDDVKQMEFVELKIIEENTRAADEDFVSSVATHGGNLVKILDVEKIYNYETKTSKVSVH